MIKKMFMYGSLAVVLIFLVFSGIIFVQSLQMISPTGFVVADIFEERNFDDVFVSVEAKEALVYINELRAEYGRDAIAFDKRTYILAYSRAKDMVKRNYTDHVTPEGTCVKDFRLDYGFGFFDILAENIGEMTHYLNYTPIESTSAKEPINLWMESRGHRFNILYEYHEGGAVACYESLCVFLGVHHKIFGLGAVECATGEEGFAFWDSLEKQKGEV